MSTKQIIPERPLRHSFATFALKKAFNRKGRKGGTRKGREEKLNFDDRTVV
jgi:hypothetical protein